MSSNERKAEKLIVFTTFSNPPFTIVEGDTWDGLEMRIFLEFCRYIGAVPRLLPAVVAPGQNPFLRGGNASSGGATLLDNLESGRAEVGFANKWLKPELLLMLDMGPPLSLTCHTFAVRPPPPASSFLNAARPFEAALWAAVVSAWALLALTHWAVGARLSPLRTGLGNSTKITFNRSLLDILGILTFTSYPQIIRCEPTRILICSTSYLALLIATAYSSSLASHLTVPNHSRSIDTLNDMVDANVFWSLHFNGTNLFDPNVSAHRVMAARQRLELSAADRLAFAADPSFAVPGYRLNGFFFPYGHTLPRGVLAQLRALRECPALYMTSVVFRKGSVWAAPFRRFVYRTQDAGLSGLWAQQVLRRASLGALEITAAEPGDSPQRLSLDNVSGAFFLLAVGLTLSTAAWIAEMATAALQC